MSADTLNPDIDPEFAGLFDDLAGLDDLYEVRTDDYVYTPLSESPSSDSPESSVLDDTDVFKASDADTLNPDLDPEFAGLFDDLAGMDDLYEVRTDDYVYNPLSETPSSASPENPTFDDADVLEASDADSEYILQPEVPIQSSWENPVEFGHVSYDVKDHMDMLRKEVESHGLVEQYDDEVLVAARELETITDVMMSTGAFMAMVCACPEDFGLTQEEAKAMFPSVNDELIDEDHSDHDHDDDKKAHGTGKSPAPPRYGAYSPHAGDKVHDNIMLELLNLMEIFKGKDQPVWELIGDAIERMVGLDPKYTN